MKANKKERMIKLSVNFFTNNIEKGKGEIEPRVCWDIGAVVIRSNRSHGIKAKTYSLRQFDLIPNVIRKALVDAGVTMQLTGNAKKLTER